jgi:hypothetical protein
MPVAFKDGGVKVYASSSEEKPAVLSTLPESARLARIMANLTRLESGAVPCRVNME